MTTITVKLRHPIAFGSETVSELTFRPVTGRDLRKLPKDGDMDIVLTLAGKLSGQPDMVIDKLTGDDLMEVLTIVSGFMPGGPPAGSEP